MTLLFLILGPPQPGYKLRYWLKGLLIGALLSALLLLQGNTFLYCLVFFSYIATDNRFIKRERAQILLLAISIFCVTLLGFEFRNTIWNSKYPWFLPQKGIHLYYLKTQSKTLGFNPLGLGILVIFSGLGVFGLVQALVQRAQSQAEAKQLEQQAEAQFNVAPAGSRGGIV